MQNTLHTTLLALLAFLLTGCEVEEEKSDYICKQAENRYIDGENGFRTVSIYGLGGSLIEVGYSHQGQLANHSECSAAKISESSASTLFEWFEYGNAVEVDGVKTIEFFNKNNLVNILATRIEATGVADMEYSERDVEFDSSARISKRVWNNELPSMIVTAEDNFDAKGEQRTEAVIGTVTKTKLWNENTQQWDCSYVTTNGNFVDTGCLDETANDITYVGFQLDLQPYFDSLADSIKYETEPEYLYDDLDSFK
ncbi:hypothetical protein A6E01_20395 (plasmid) [Vibrio breoganii]|uniref:Uncharacterized protein n=1 Tax=Vibrio breoganii TaxID=553239 RepID=A0AAN0XZN1_9VIBR|nr:hypothetical protein [Vibrio breoganii]ANO35575.1 hypothetical protein A6E01_20395 [Vibrio breoganii]